VGLLERVLLERVRPIIFINPALVFFLADSRLWMADYGWRIVDSEL